MFDFIAIIGKQDIKSVFAKNYTSINYLKSIEYSEDEIIGKYFITKYKYHTKDRLSGYFYKDEIHIFKIGNVFINNRYREKNSAFNGALEEIDLISLYTNYGTDLAKYIKGIFLLLIFDEKQNQYFAFQSICGLYDLYSYKSENFIILSTCLDLLINSNPVPKKIDNISLLQHIIFDYPLSEKTLFQEVNLLPSQTYLCYDLNTVKTNKYFNYLPLLRNSHKLSWDETLREIPAIFNNTIDTITSTSDKICSAITSGFDSRANLSRLVKIEKDVLYYSWGMPGSLEIRVPLEIVNKMKLNHLPIYLDEDFESKYGYYAKQAIFWSGGKATIRRANHNYGHEILSQYSREVLTGLIGSELIRPANAVGHIFTKDFIDILYSTNKEAEIERIINKQIHRSFIKESFFNSNRDDLINETLAYFKKFEDYGEKHIQLYLFSLNEGFRKYFGHEIHGCRMHVNINTPYIDDDFVEFILNTPIPDLNIYAFKRNPDSLRKGQLVYLPIIQSNCKDLLYMRTGRFYKPKDLLSPIYPLSVMPGIIRKYLHQSRSNDTFNTEKWNSIMFKSEQKVMNLDNSIFNNLNMLVESKPEHLVENQQFNWNMHIAKHFSIRLWLDSFNLS